MVNREKIENIGKSLFDKCIVNVYRSKIGKKENALNTNIFNKGKIKI